MTARPWMPLYIADYLADTAHLNAAQSGAYLHLIMHYWQTGSLPDNDAALSRIARMTAGEWNRNRSVIAPFFADGWKHKRIDAELAHAADVSSKRRASAEQRHNKSDAIAEQKETHAGASSQSQSQTEKKEPSAPKKKPTRIPENWQPTPAGLAYAAQHGLSQTEIPREIERFRNYHGGKGTTMLDWSKAWQNWVLKAAELLGRKPLSPNGNGAAIVNEFGDQVSWPKRADYWKRTGKWLETWGRREDIPAEFAPLFFSPESKAEAA